MKFRLTATANRVAKIVTVVGLIMLIASVAMAWDLSRQRLNPMGDPEFRFMVKVVKPWIITASLVLLVGCGLCSVILSRRNALITGGILSALSTLFAFTMSLFVSIHDWTAIFILLWLVGCVAAAIFLSVAVGRYVGNLVRGTR